MALTDLKIKKAKAKDRPYKIYDSLGLFVLVKPNGSKLWRQKYQLDGKERTIAHGSYPAVSLRDARNRRDEIRGQLTVICHLQVFLGNEEESRSRLRFSFNLFEALLDCGVGASRELATDFVTSVACIPE